MHRRDFLYRSAGSAAFFSLGASLAARPAIKRNGPANFQLGLAAYSFRKSFPYLRGKAL